MFPSVRLQVGKRGKTSASRISSRMAFVRKPDIEKMLAGNPYHRVLLGASSNKPSKKPSFSSSSSLSWRKDKNHIPEIDMRSSKLYVSAKRNDIPMCKIAGKNYYIRKHMDALFGISAEIEALTEWLTTDEAESLYSMTKESLCTQAYRHIPTKREYGKTYYSKIHLDEIFRPDLKASDAYYTTAEAAEKYGMTKSNICVIVKTNNLTKVKVGVRNLIVKEELDRIMESRRAQFGAFRLQ